MNKPRKRAVPGRPPGRTRQGRETQATLYRTAVDLFTRRGYHGTTMRAVAAEAGVSPALLYKYFPGKPAVVLALYHDRSLEFARRSEEMPRGGWRARASFAMRTSLAVLADHRDTLRALLPVLVGDPEQGLFSRRNVSSRELVRKVFVDAVRDAKDAPSRADAERLGRVLWVVHLAVLLWWLYDHSHDQWTTDRLLRLLDRLGAAAALALRLPGAKQVLRTLDELIEEGLLDASGNRGADLV